MALIVGMIFAHTVIFVMANMMRKMGQNSEGWIFNPIDLIAVFFRDIGDQIQTALLHEAGPFNKSHN